jgi:flagellar hook assembly protein FlgD
MAFEDLLKDSSFPLDNKNYFNLVITDLNISTSYPLQFRWKYEDGSFGPWSVAKTIATSAESFPNVPSTLTVADNTAGHLQITWNGNSSTGAALTNFDRVDIYINGNPFDSSKAALSFFSAGTKTIVAPAGTYIVSAFAVSKIGTLSAMNTAVTRTITSAVPAALASATPSTPTVSSVLGAIQVSWDGKQSDGSSQPYGFNAAKVYVGTSAGFTPSASNQVDILNFANGQNTLNIGVGTIVNSVALTYGVDYYVKIATTNGTDTSTAVSATGNPVQIGKVTSGDIVTINADKIATGTLDAGSTITVGSTAGKHVVIAGTGDPLTIYGSGGVPGGAILSFNGAKLSIVGDGTFSGNLAIGSTSTASVFKAEPATGIWLGDQTYASAPFSVSTNGVIKANSGTIGGWTLASTYLQSNNVQIDGANGIIYAGPTGGAHIRISSGGLASYTGGTANNVLNIAANGQITATNVTLSGAITATSGSFTGSITSTTGTIAGFTMDADGLVNSGSTLRLFAGTTGINNIYSIYTTKAARFGEYLVIQGSTGFGSYSLVTEKGMSIANGGLTIDSNGKFSSNATFTDYIYYPGYPISTSGGAARVNDATTPTARLVAASGSSIRFKENVVNISEKEGLDPAVLLNLPVRSFTYKQGYLPEDDARYGMDLPGFIAEELEQIYPIAVDRDADGTPQRWNADFIIPGLLKIIQTQNHSIESVKSRLDALEG